MDEWMSESKDKKELGNKSSKLVEKYLSGSGGSTEEFLKDSADALEGYLLEIRSVCADMKNVLRNIEAEGIVVPESLEKMIQDLSITRQSVYNISNHMEAQDEPVVNQSETDES